MVAEAMTFRADAERAALSLGLEMARQGGMAVMPDGLVVCSPMLRDPHVIEDLQMRLAALEARPA